MTRVPQKVASVNTYFLLVKFAPFRTSWRDIIMAGQFALRGVRSHAARKNLQAMRLARILFYHSQKEKAIVGVLKVTRPAYPDPTSADPKWLTCDFAPTKTLTRPVTLKELRSLPQFADLPLLRQPRLSVMPISSNHYELIIRLSEESETGVK